MSLKWSKLGRRAFLKYVPLEQSLGEIPHPDGTTTPRVDPLHRLVQPTAGRVIKRLV